MDRAVAEELIRLVKALDGSLNAATEATAKIADPEERKAVRRAIAEIIVKADEDLIRPIVRQYPDLDPDK
jgi:hypothetical protein